VEDGQHVLRRREAGLRALQQQAHGGLFTGQAAFLLEPDHGGVVGGGRIAGLCRRQKKQLGFLDVAGLVGR
jgi:hypothetical protein